MDPKLLTQKLLDDFDPDEVEAVAHGALNSFNDLNDRLKELGFQPNHTNARYCSCLWLKNVAWGYHTHVFRVRGECDAYIEGWGITAIEIILLSTEKEFAPMMIDHGSYRNANPDWVLSILKKALSTMRLVAEDFDPDEVEYIAQSTSMPWRAKMDNLDGWQKINVAIGGNPKSDRWFKVWVDVPGHMGYMAYARVTSGGYGRFGEDGEEESVLISLEYAHKVQVEWTHSCSSYFPSSEVMSGVAWATRLIESGEVIPNVPPLAGIALQPPQQESEFDPEEVEALMSVPHGPFSLETVDGNNRFPHIAFRGQVTSEWHPLEQAKEIVNQLNEYYLTNPTYKWKNFGSEEPFDWYLRTKYKEPTALLRAKTRDMRARRRRVREDFDPDEVEAIADPLGPLRDFHIVAKSNGLEQTGRWKANYTYDPSITALRKELRDNKYQWSQGVVKLLIGNFWDDRGKDRVPGAFCETNWFFWGTPAKFTQIFYDAESLDAFLKAVDTFSKKVGANVDVRDTIPEPAAFHVFHSRYGRMTESDEFSPEEVEAVASSSFNAHGLRVTRRQDFDHRWNIRNKKGEAIGTFKQSPLLGLGIYLYVHLDPKHFDVGKAFVSCSNRFDSIDDLLNHAAQFYLGDQVKEDFHPDEIESVADPLGGFQEVCRRNGLQLGSSLSPLYRGDPKVTEWHKSLIYSPNEAKLGVVEVQVGTYWNVDGRSRLPGSVVATSWYILGRELTYSHVFYTTDALETFLKDLDRWSQRVGGAEPIEVEDMDNFHNYYSRVTESEIDPEEIEQVATASFGGLRLRPEKAGNDLHYRVYEGDEYLGTIMSDYDAAFDIERWLIVRCSLDTMSPAPLYSTWYASQEEAIRDLKQIINRRKHGSGLPRSRVASLDLDESQEFTSAKTCLKQVPALHKWLMAEGRVRPGMLVVDIGGGKYDLATESLAKYGVTNLVLDPFNRSEEHNQAVLEQVSGGKVDVAICANTLNVIKERSNRLQVVARAAESLKPGGHAYFSVYKAPKGKGRSSEDSWQEGRPIQTYLPEIRKLFEDVEVVHGYVVASKPKKDQVSEYDTQPAVNLPS